MSEPSEPDLAGIVHFALEAETKRRLALASEPHRLAPLVLRAAPGDRPVRICFLAPRVDVGGGARILFEHASRLGRSGFDVRVLSHFPRPEWYPLIAGYQRVPVGMDLVDAIEPCDVVVAGYWSQVLAARLHGGAPVVHFEQGDFHLYEHLDVELERTVAANLRAADRTITVSRGVAALLRDRFGVEADVVPNAIDPDVFSVDGARDDAGLAAGPRIIAVGWDGRAFKGIPAVVEATRRLRDGGHPVSLVWVTPEPPLSPPAPDDPVTVIVNPPQERLAALYRGASVYVCASHYETFPLPPLEAMACGVPVVTTANVGSLEYTEHGVNSLHVPLDDLDAMVEAIATVLNDPVLACRLRRGGQDTATQFSWLSIIEELAVRYRGLAGWEPRRPGTAAPWDMDLSGLSFADGGHELLEQRLEACDAAAVAIPVAHPFGHGLRLVRWTVVARNPSGLGTLRLLVPARSLSGADNRRWDGPGRVMLAGRPLEALAVLAAQYQEASMQDQASVGRFVALALMAGDRSLDAESVLRMGRLSFPDHADYQLLSTLLSGPGVDDADGSWRPAVLSWLGTPARHDEWFEVAEQAA